MFQTIDESIHNDFDNKESLENIDRLLAEKLRYVKFYILICEISYKLKPVYIQSDFRIHMKEALRSCKTIDEVKTVMEIFIANKTAYKQMEESDRWEIIIMIREGLSKI
jgi:hypothetical protein